MVKSHQVNLVELGDTVSSVYFPEIVGIVSCITRNAQNIVGVDLEQWIEENGSMNSHRINLCDARGKNGESFETNPKNYDGYFPKDEEGEFKFKLNEWYRDIHTPLQGLAVSHGVCLTGCDRTKLAHYKKDDGLYGMSIDLNRISLIDEYGEISGETAEETINEDRREVGGPIECSKL